MMYGLILQKRRNKKKTYARHYPRINHNLCSLSIKKHVNGISFLPMAFARGQVRQESFSLSMYSWTCSLVRSQVLTVFGTSFSNKRLTQFFDRVFFLSFFFFNYKTIFQRENRKEGEKKIDSRYF